MKRKFAIIALCAIVIMMIGLYSCAKREPERTPNSDALTNKIASQFNELSIVVEEDKARELFDEKNDVDFSKIENFSIRQAKDSEVGVFKLYTHANVDYVKDVVQKRVLKLQENAKNNFNVLRIANNAEVRSYGNYVYYVSHAEKDRIFKIIEEALNPSSEKKVKG